MWRKQNSDLKLTVSNCSVLKTCQFYVQYSYRQIPTFGRDTIRKFDTNVSAMKKLAARDWEDLLQVNLNIDLGCSEI